jgi:hypothetical protein
MESFKNRHQIALNELCGEGEGTGAESYARFQVAATNRLFYNGNIPVSCGSSIGRFDCSIQETFLN